MNSKLDNSIFDYDVVELETVLQNEQQFRLMQGNCLELMKELPDGSVDMILADPPYGTTACKWDVIIPFDQMWAELNRIIKPNGAIVLFGSEPFSSMLRCSNLKMFKYDWVWEKTRPSNPMLAKRRPLSYHENIIVFGDRIEYRPQMVIAEKAHNKQGRKLKASESNGIKENYVNDAYSKLRYPKSIVRFDRGEVQVHPTQKPVSLLEYLIKTYTQEGETVLDFTMGSGSTGVACVNTGRKFIGMELDEDYYQVASDRISGTKRQGEQS